MLEDNCQKILGMLRDSDQVLDVGGWACPFNRANFILDTEPYETRGFYRTFGERPYQGPENEFFNKDSWVQRDICDRKPWPFSNKQFDFAVCSHTLEDVRDPIGVCSELIRVAKRGYIEVPSVAFELTRDREIKGMPGLSHHRWLVVQSENNLCFVQKYQFVHHHWRFSFPNSFDKKLNRHQKVLSFFWDDSFVADELILHGPETQQEYIQKIVQDIMPYSSFALGFDRNIRKVGWYFSRGFSKIKRMMFH